MLAKLFKKRTGYGFNNSINIHLSKSHLKYHIFSICSIGCYKQLQRNGKDNEIIMAGETSKSQGKRNANLGTFSILTPQYP